ncbi:MAG: hypothetical protein MR029_10115 [Clostridium sp.]|nr:hypothetical protein [Clostridium sp.]
MKKTIFIFALALLFITTYTTDSNASMAKGVNYTSFPNYFYATSGASINTTQYCRKSATGAKYAECYISSFKGSGVFTVSLGRLKHNISMTSGGTARAQFSNVPRKGTSLSYKGSLSRTGATAKVYAGMY